MPPAARKSCDYPGCACGTPDEDGNREYYITPVGLQTWAEVNMDPQQHVEMAHVLPIKQLEAQQAAMQAKANLATAVAAKLREELGPAGPAEPVTTD